MLCVVCGTLLGRGMPAGPTEMQVCRGSDKKRIKFKILSYLFLFLFIFNFIYFCSFHSVFFFFMY